VKRARIRLITMVPVALIPDLRMFSVMMFSLLGMGYSPPCSWCGAAHQGVWAVCAAGHGGHAVDHVCKVVRSVGCGLLVGVCFFGSRVQRDEFLM
jgi:hypothetical protein